MSVLHRDLLYEIAEKILCPHDEHRVDVREAAKFMFINNDCKNAFLAQFSKMKCVDIFFRFGGMDVNLYKSRNNERRELDLEYIGPYATNAAFISLLLKYNRFHPRSLYINDAFSSRTDIVEDTDLFLNEYWPMLDSVEINQPDGLVNWTMLSKILNLNSKQYDIMLNVGYEEINTIFSSCEASSKVISDATTQIILRYRFFDEWDTPFDFNLWKTQRWRLLLIFLIERCPNVESIEIVISSIAISNSQTDDFMEMMEWIIGWFVQNVLPLLTETCDLCLHFRFCISDAVYSLSLTETKTKLISSIFAELQFDTFFEIVTPLILWVIANMLPKMRQKCTVEMWLRLAFADNRRKELLMERLEPFAELTDLVIVDGVEFNLIEFPSYTQCVKTATKDDAFEMLWYI